MNNYLIYQYDKLNMNNKTATKVQLYNLKRHKKIKLKLTIIFFIKIHKI